MTAFQTYLIENGFKRTCLKFNKVVEDYSNTTLSTYGPIQYDFKKDRHWFYWGLSEQGKPPVMHLGKNKMVIKQNKDNFRTVEDGYRILFSKLNESEYERVLAVATSTDKFFTIDCTDEKNIIITIES